MIFVFGSNEAGIHGAGAALHAVQHCGAIGGKGYGRQGNSFAIPTKNRKLLTLSPVTIQGYAHLFIAYAIINDKEEFQVTRIGCGLAGLRDEDMAPMFFDAPKNCLFDEAWKPWLPKKRFWGTF